MCVIIDKNFFGPVFEKDSKYHGDFKPIYKWVSEGFGKIVYGGSTYKDELKQSTKYLRLFRRYDTARRTIKIPDEDVDKIEKIISKELEENIKPHYSKHDFDRKFNDPHIISIVIASKCRIVCTNDDGLSDFLKMSQFYPKGVEIPKIYKNKSNQDMIKDDNIAKICKPCEKLKKVKHLP